MKEKINAIIQESENTDIENTLDEVPLYTDLLFKLDTISIAFKNVDIRWLNKVSSKKIIIKEIFMCDWYMYGAYDKISILDSDFLITIKTQKKIELVRAN